MDPTANFKEQLELAAGIVASDTKDRDAVRLAKAVMALKARLDKGDTFAAAMATRKYAGMFALADGVLDDGDPGDSDAGYQLAERIVALDEWIRKGGFPPAAVPPGDS